MPQNPQGSKQFTFLRSAILNRSDSPPAHSLLLHTAVDSYKQLLQSPEEEAGLSVSSLYFKNQRNLPQKLLDFPTCLIGQHWWYIHSKPIPGGRVIEFLLLGLELGHRIETCTPSGLG